jgi:hypothetical protein
MRSAPLVSLFCLTIVGSLGLVFLGGCSSKPKPAATATTAASAQPQTIHVGEVAVVDERKRFVLIDLQSNLYVPEPGVTLRTMRDATETAKLKVTPERKRPFIAADVIEGQPAVGDEVMQ